MATEIIQQPLYTFVPVGQELIYTVANPTQVATKKQVKFVAEVYISADVPPTMTGSTNKVATFKTTPNNAGVGMFDFREVIETFVKADHLAYERAEYKEVLITSNDYVPIHLIDKGSRAANSIKYLGIKFSTERFSSVSNSLIQYDEFNSEIKKIFNGYLSYSEQLRQGTGAEQYYYGYNMKRFNLNGTAKEFLTNAPDTQYANQGDYGTAAIMLGINGIAPATDGAVRIKFTYFTYLSGSSSEFYNIDASNGGPASNSQISLIYNNILFFGVFPGNLQNWSTMYNGIGTDIDYYTYKIEGVGGVDLSKEYTIKVNCPESIPGGSSAFPVTPKKGYEPIRLCWLNQWGAWDYYTFTLKSTKTIMTKGTTYNQLGGSWNNNVYRYQMHKGGKKNFRVNATEKLKINTDYITEEDAVWLEELMNSPETYMILKGYDVSEASTSILNDYMCPVRLLTKSYVRKTVANDKLIQYTFEIEKSKILRTQSI
tara:strand:- start:240 stop:1694 length:1455 start_codon:yes stop_codon:yes gene_type:complete